MDTIDSISLTSAKAANVKAACHWFERTLTKGNQPRLQKKKPMCACCKVSDLRKHPMESCVGLAEMTAAHDEKSGTLTNCVLEEHK